MQGANDWKYLPKRDKTSILSGTSYQQRVPSRLLHLSTFIALLRVSWCIKEVSLRLHWPLLVLIGGKPGFQTRTVPYLNFLFVDIWTPLRINSDSGKLVPKGRGQIVDTMVHHFVFFRKLEDLKKNDATASSIAARIAPC